jgi:putative membrane protein
MTNILLTWLASIVSLFIVTWIVPGVSVSGFGAAAVAAVVIGLLNATLGNILKLLGLPIVLLTFGLAALVINALMLMLASGFVPGFHVSGFFAAFIGSIVLSIVSWVVSSILKPNSDKRRD